MAEIKKEKDAQEDVQEIVPKPNKQKELAPKPNKQKEIGYRSKDHERNGLVKVVWDYQGESLKYNGKKLVSWVKPEIAALYKGKMAKTDKVQKPVREPIEVR